MFPSFIKDESMSYLNEAVVEKQPHSCWNGDERLANLRQYNLPHDVLDIWTCWAIEVRPQLSLSIPYNYA